MPPTGRRLASPREEGGFTLVEILVSAALLIVVASNSVILLTSARQLTQKPSHRSEAIYFSSETLETLKDYVTTRTADPKYQFSGDGGRYALAGGGANHTHALPPGVFRDNLAPSSRTYGVVDVDVSIDFDSNGDGFTGNDIDYKQVTVTVQWQDQE